jgi:hypothetical protein
MLLQDGEFVKFYDDPFVEGVLEWIYLKELIYK